MSKQVKKHHVFHFVLLLIMLALSSALIVVFRYHVWEQTYITLGTAAFYVIWGVMHHQREKDLHPKIILEYLAMAIIGSTILISIITKL